MIPLSILILYNVIARSPVAKHEVTYLPFAISLVLTSFLTDIVKKAVGRPRPDLLDRCHPTGGTKENVLVNIEVCTAEEGHKLQDGWRSFPSGHSSFSFAGLGFLALFLAGQLHVFHHPHRWKRSWAGSALSVAAHRRDNDCYLSLRRLQT